MYITQHYINYIHVHVYTISSTCNGYIQHNTFTNKPVLYDLLHDIHKRNTTLP